MNNESLDLENSFTTDDMSLADMLKESQEASAYQQETHGMDYTDERVRKATVYMGQINRKINNKVELNNRERIMVALFNAWSRGKKVHMAVLNAITYRYSARISELREILGDEVIKTHRIKAGAFEYSLNLQKAEV